VINIKGASFVAEVRHVMDKSRFKESGFTCTLLQGGICKGDVVQLLDKDMDFIVEEKINTICHSRIFVDAVKKGDTKDDFVYLLFKQIWEYPINETKYIVKLSESALSKYKQKTKAVPLLINNERPYEQLITGTVDIDCFVNRFYIEPLSRVLGYYFLDIYNGIGIECLRETERGALYSVHKVKQGGLLYIYYARLEYSPYVKVAGWYYVQKKLSSDDFKDIKKGSTLRDIVAIDPAARIYEDLYNGDPDLYHIRSVGLDTFHFLSDGILKIHLQNIHAEVIGGEMRVSKKTFVDFADIGFVQSGSRIVSLDGHLLPMDRID